MDGSYYAAFFKMKRFLLLSALIILAGQFFGQTAFTWYFGNQAGIKFNPDGSTVPAFGSYMSTGEGCTIVSDTNGIIMFYSEGVNVWNNSSPTPVCNDLIGGQSSTQAALGLPIPGSGCQNFLIFTTKGIEQSGNHDLGVALVNVTGSAPNYVVSVSEPAMSVLQPPGIVTFAEKLAAISDTNGGYWIVAHDYIAGSGVANTFYKYHITAAGFSSVTTTAQAQNVLSLIQQTQSIGSNHNDPSPPDYNGQGQMKFSKTGQKLGLVLAGSKTIDLFHFDLSSGTLTSIATTIVSPSFGNLYGCEFSPDGNVFYTSEGFASSVSTIRNLYQWDISSGNLSNPYIVASGGDQTIYRYKYNALQLGPNDKVYCSEEEGVSYLSVINNPDNLGSTCGWSSMTEAIANTNALGLPTVMVNFGCACLPSPGLITGPDPVCQGDTAKIYSVNVVNGATGYNWSVPPGAIITSGNNTNSIKVKFPPTSTSGSFSVYAFNAICNGLTSPVLPVTVSPVPLVNLGPDTTVCLGQTVTFDAGACGGCTYLWKNIGAGLTVGTGQTYTTGQAGYYRVTVTNGSGCQARDSVQLFTVTPPVETNNPLAESICSGTFTNIILTSNDPSATFSWTATGSPSVSGYSDGSGSTINQLLSNASIIPETVTYVITPASGNCAGNPVSYVVTVIPLSPVTVSITASANNICAGTSVTFNATSTNGGPTPSYQWKVNGIDAGSNSPAYTYVPLNGDIVNCVFTSSNLSCVSNNPATSNSISMVVNPVSTVNISIAASATAVCLGTSVTFTATPVNGGLFPSFQWQVNNINAGLDSPVFTYTPANNDQVTCILTSSETICVLNNPDTSNAITMTVSSNLPVNATISASANPVCSGSSVTFTAVPVNGGPLPTYQWKINGVNAGPNSNLFTYTPLNNDAVFCILTSNLSCVTGNPATSNTIIMSINGNPIVTFTPCIDTITALTAKNIKIKGGIPLGGTYSGPGVNPVTGTFDPATAGMGTKTITYTYINTNMCTGSQTIHIIVHAAPLFSCGNNLTDIRDNKTYSTVQIGSQCWMASNLNYGLSWCHHRTKEIIVFLKSIVTTTILTIV